VGSYVDWHASLYDLFYADKPYQAEAAFVAARLADEGVRAGARLLELACGTGRHALALEQQGYEVVATDYSETMLACARQRKEASRSTVELRLQDMSALDLPGAPFDAAVSFFDSIGYLQTNERVLQALRGIHRHLRPAGLLVMEFWHAAAMLRSYEPVRMRRFSNEEGEVLRVSETTLDHERQLGHVKYTIVQMLRAGGFRQMIETQTNRFFLVQEMAGYLHSAGFDPLRWFSGFDADRPIGADSWHIVVVARRRS
jgi:ubiquinone/menaquinone biosynthesis C-methylase UbiE